MPTYNADILPSVTGKNLGSSSQRWNLDSQTIDNSGNATISGNLSVVGTQSFTGNTTVAGTLGVTGATTLTGAASCASTLAVAGATTAAAVTASGLVTGNGGFSGVIGATGASAGTFTGITLGSVGLTGNSTNTDLHPKAGGQLTVYSNDASSYVRFDTSQNINVHNSASVSIGSGTASIFDANGKLTQYANVSLVGNGIPTSVADIHSTGQGASIGTTNLVASPGTGLYTIHAYIIITTVDGVSSTLPKITIGWTDPDNSVAQTLDITATSSGNTTATYKTGIATIRVSSAAAITYATAGYVSNTPSQMKYAVSIRAQAQ